MMRIVREPFVLRRDGECAWRWRAGAHDDRRSLDVFAIARRMTALARAALSSLSGDTLREETHEDDEPQGRRNRRPDAVRLRARIEERRSRGTRRRRRI